MSPTDNLHGEVSPALAHPLGPVAGTLESILTPSGAETTGRRAPEVHWSRPAKGPAVRIDPGVHCSPADHTLVSLDWYKPQLHLWRDTRLVPTPVCLVVPVAEKP